MKQVYLPDGSSMPQLGQGTWQMGEDDNKYEREIAGLRHGIELGMTLIDTAEMYADGKAENIAGNAAKPFARESLYICDKVYPKNADRKHIYSSVERSLKLLGTDYIDLYLIHWPADGWQQAWDDLQEIYASGRAKAIGVSNFQKHHIDELLTHSDVVPAVDQVESSPQFTNQELIDQLRAKGIHTEAWSPLGGTGGNLLSNPVLAGIGAKYGKSAAQVVIRWHIQRGIVVLPKSTHAERIKQNFEVFDFNLSVDDMTAISAINTGKRNGADPDNFNF